MTFALATKHANCPDAQIMSGRYPNGSVGWVVMGDCGDGVEPIGTPTVALDELPPEGCVFIKVTEEYEGWLECLARANVIEDTGERMGSGWINEYAAICRVLKPELLQSHTPIL